MPSAPREPLLFALPGGEALARRVALLAGWRPAEIDLRRFPDGESACRPLDAVENRRVGVLAALRGDGSERGHGGGEALCRLLFFLRTLRDAGAAHVQAMVSYFAFARQDRRTRPQDPLTARYVAELIEAAGADAVAVLEAHNPVAMAHAFRRPLRHVDAGPCFAEHYAGTLQRDAVAVVAPDPGGIARSDGFSRLLAGWLARPVEQAWLHKQREAPAACTSRLAGSVAGRTVILYDDMVSTGATLSAAAEACHAAGAARILAAATHGLWCAGAVERLLASRIEQVAIGNSLPPDEAAAARLGQRLQVVDLAPALAAALLAPEGTPLP